MGNMTNNQNNLNNNSLPANNLNINHPKKSKKLIIGLIIFNIILVIGIIIFFVFLFTSSQDDANTSLNNEQNNENLIGENANNQADNIETNNDSNNNQSNTENNLIGSWTATSLEVSSILREDFETGSLTINLDNTWSSTTKYQNNPELSSRGTYTNNGDTILFIIEETNNPDLGDATIGIFTIITNSMEIIYDSSIKVTYEKQ